MTARPIRRNAQTPDRNGKIFYTSTTSLSHISKSIAHRTNAPKTYLSQIRFHARSYINQRQQSSVHFPQNFFWNTSSSNTCPTPAASSIVIQASCPSPHSAPKIKLAASSTFPSKNCTHSELFYCDLHISICVPHAGDDCRKVGYMLTLRISIHIPLAGDDMQGSDNDYYLH